MLRRIVQSLMKKSSVVDRMKTKNFYIVIGFIVVTSGSLWLISFPSPTFQNIVTKTHKGIKNLPSNIQIQVLFILFANSAVKKAILNCLLYEIWKWVFWRFINYVLKSFFKKESVFILNSICNWRLRSDCHFHVLV